MQRNLTLCKRYAQGFRPGAKSLLFSGATGLGKTFLSACIARQVADEGWGVVYVTASALFADYEAVRFGRAEDWRRRIEEATGETIVHTVVDAEPLGPARPLELLILSPCTGTTLAKIAQGITDTAITMAAKEE